MPRWYFTVTLPKQKKLGRHSDFGPLIVGAHGTAASTATTASTDASHRDPQPGRTCRVLSFITLICIASANRLAAANPLAPRHRQGPSRLARTIGQRRGSASRRHALGKIEGSDIRSHCSSVLLVFTIQI